MTKMTDHNENTTHMTATHNTLVFLCSSDSCVIGGILLPIFVHPTFIVYSLGCPVRVMMLVMMIMKMIKMTINTMLM